MGTSNENIRCFISLNLPDLFREKVVEVQQRLKEQQVFNGKFTGQQNLHLTLKFLGEISPQQIVNVRKQLRQIQVEKFRISLDGAGVFSPKHVKIIWVRVKGADSLQKQIDEALADIFAAETRFMGHITIARVKSTENKAKLIEAVKELKVPSLTDEVACFYLMKSTLTSKGPIYEVMEAFGEDTK